MSTRTAKPPWYVSGLAFECQQCGQCCAGPAEGYVWVTEEEIAAIARHLGISAEEARKEYIRRVRWRYSLREVDHTKDCIFLATGPTGVRHCAVYPVRPTQCRSWPFWPGNLRSPEAWAHAGMRCRGINRGRTIPVQHIEAMANATDQ